MPPDPKVLKKYRYERKFLTTEFSEEEAETLVKLHPAIFREVYPPRFVNNIYFDSLDFDNLFDNLDGLAARRKVRIRWYGSFFGRVERPSLEFKVKNGLIGQKDLYPLPPLTLDENLTFAKLKMCLKESDLPNFAKLDLDSLEPTLLNRYRRRYFQSFDKNYRLTIDSQLCFWPINNHSNSFLYSLRDAKHIVMELKYHPDQDGEAQKITNYFPFRLTKNSKYVFGLEWL